MIVNLKIEVGVVDSALFDQAIKELRDQGLAPKGVANNPAEAIGELIAADIPFRDAGLELIHWESQGESQ